MYSKWQSSINKNFLKFDYKLDLIFKKNVKHPSIILTTWCNILWKFCKFAKEKVINIPVNRSIHIRVLRSKEITKTLPPKKKPLKVIDQHQFAVLKTWKSFLSFYDTVEDEKSSTHAAQRRREEAKHSHTHTWLRKKTRYFLQSNLRQNKVAGKPWASHA